MQPGLGRTMTCRPCEELCLKIDLLPCVVGRLSSPDGRCRASCLRIQRQHSLLGELSWQSPRGWLLLHKYLSTYHLNLNSEHRILHKIPLTMLIEVKWGLPFSFFLSASPNIPVVTTSAKAGASRCKVIKATNSTQSFDSADTADLFTT